MGRDGAEGDFEQFLEMRRHVRRLQGGTPLLLRTTSAGGQEDLSICTFWVTQDLQTLRWRDQEGSGSVREVPLSAVTEVEEERSGDDGNDEDGHYALILKLKRPGSAPTAMGLICSSSEDLESWRDGLKFLVRGPPQANSAAAAPTGAGATAQDGELRRRLQLQEELCERLQQENGMLREIVKRKDATIAELLRDNQSRPTAAERCNKTESTSRESDEHLQFREVAILRRKNRRLQKDLKAKQQTVAELLQLVGRVTQQQGAESSAPEDDARGEGNEEDEEDEDTLPPGPGPAGKAPGSAPRAAASVASVARSPSGAVADNAGGEPEIFRDEMRALAGKLEMLERAAAAATQGLNSPFQPPARSIPAGASPAVTTSPSKAIARTEPLLVAAGTSKSTAALKALASEMALLEEKKRVVERLARSLEPGSDGDDEDDGFPLR